MNTNRFCPVIQTENGQTKCMKTNCAWWDDDKQKCIVFSINDSIKRMSR